MLHVRSEAYICPVVPRNCARGRPSSNHQNPLYQVMIILLRLHSGALLSPQRPFPSPLGKTLCLATVTVAPGSAWALCSRGEHGNALLYRRFHDASSYLLNIASLLLHEFVTLKYHCDIDL
jgi:hypothetical protein